MKRIYDFTLSKQEDVEFSTTEEKDGKEVKITRKEKRPVDKKFFLKRPTRKLYDEAELFYGVKLSEGIKAGLLTRALLAKRFSNDGGVLSDPEREEFTKLYSELFEKQVELQILSSKDEKDRTKKEKEKIEEIKKFLTISRAKIQEFESNQSSLYDQTAENRARNKTILWWVLQLSYSDDGGEEKSFFGEGDYENRLRNYDKMEEDDDEWTMVVVNKFFYYVSFWFVSKASTQEQFEELIKFAEKSDLESSKVEDEDSETEEVVTDSGEEEKVAETKKEEVKTEVEVEEKL